jgi:hypothetical protein
MESSRTCTQYKLVGRPTTTTQIVKSPKMISENKDDIGRDLHLARQTRYAAAAAIAASRKQARAIQNSASVAADVVIVKAAPSATAKTTLSSNSTTAPMQRNLTRAVE